MDRQNGTNHKQFKHPTIHSTATVNGKLSDDVRIENLKSIQRQTIFILKNLQIKAIFLLYGIKILTDNENGNT